MRIIPTRNTKYFIIIFLSLFVLVGQPAKLGKEKAFFHGYLIQKPIIRIGLGINLSEIKIRSSSGMKVYEVKTNYKLLADDASEVHIRGHREKLTEKFVIQVTQTRKGEEAEIIAQDLRTKIENKVYVTGKLGNNIGKIFQVKVGDFLTRGTALSFIKKLNQIGVKDTWILREEVTEEESKPLWIVVNDELKSLNDDTLLFFIPSHRRSFLSFNERAYRGIFILQTSRKGIILINILNLEDYLKGVVPSELSPYNFGEIEAHKAQAVAARTYAIKNLGMNDELGFDLCDTPNSQYYKGMNAEHPLSCEAVDLTKGEVALYRGKLINALYTSTCGGMTENVESVFEGPSLPYLRSTECVYEKQNEWQLKSQNIIAPIQVNGVNISPKIAWLISLRVIPPELNLDYYSQQASFEEAISWVRNALALLGKKNEDFAPESSPLNFSTLARLIIGAFEWQERVDNLFLESECDYILKDFEGLKDEARDYLAYLIQVGIFSSSSEIGNLERVLARGELAYYLEKVMQSYKDLSCQGIFKGLSKDKIELEEEKEKKRLDLSPDVFLFKNNEDGYSFASHLYLLEGEKVRWVEREGEVQLLEVDYSPYTNILDRSSASHRWQLRVSKEALEKRINQFYPIGELEDLVPQIRGDSKRVLELLIKGTDSQVIVKGFRIRRVLDLKETLFVIEREYDEEGHIVHFTFLGRGWGHGVGLCQVGAFGMAQAGANYREILKKYYRSIKIGKIY